MASGFILISCVVALEVMEEPVARAVCKEDAGLVSEGWTIEEVVDAVELVVVSWDSSMLPPL